MLIAVFRSPRGAVEIPVKYFERVPDVFITTGRSKVQRRYRTDIPLRRRDGDYRFEKFRLKRKPKHN